MRAPVKVIRRHAVFLMTGKLLMYRSANWLLKTDSALNDWPHPKLKQPSPTRTVY